MKIVIAPDSFKSTATAFEAAKAMERGVRSVLPDAEVVSFPLSDGGEGLMEALRAEPMPVSVTDPFFNITGSAWGLLGDGKAVVELSRAAGYSMAMCNPNPEITTTYGVGDLICEAIDYGCREIFVGLGGSCTNDGGTGIAAALGAAFFDASGYPIVPVGSTLGTVSRIDLSCVPQKVRDVRFRLLCDVTNPLCGEKGASFVFAPQKGADAAMVERLEAGMRHYAALLERTTGHSVLTLEGGGAAGGCGAGLCALFGAEIVSGIETVLSHLHFDEALCGADLVLTGEGCFDGQSRDGKVVCGVASHAQAAGVPVILVCGMSKSDPMPERGIESVIAITDHFPGIGEARRTVMADIEAAAAKAVRPFARG